MEVQPQLVLLQKTLLNIEGLGRQLYPDLDLWVTAKPFLEDWMEEQVGVRAMMRSLKEDLPYLLEKLPEMPNLLHDALKRSADGEQMAQQIKELQQLREDMQRSNTRSVVSTTGASLTLGAVLVYALDGYAPAMFLGIPALSWGLGAVGLFMLIYALQD